MASLTLPKGWKEVELGSVLKRIRRPVDLNASTMYREIGVRSHGKGIFYKEERTGESIGKKSVFWIVPDCFIMNIVFAWEQAITKTTTSEKGMIASHRFPMYKPTQGKLDLEYLVYFFLSPRGKYLLGLASPGGAGRNKTLGQQEFLNLAMSLPPYNEQCRIVEILTTWDKAIILTEKLIAAKQEFKKGLMQQLLTGKKRFEEILDHKWKNVHLKDIVQDFVVPMRDKPKEFKGNIPWCKIEDFDGVFLSTSKDGKTVDQEIVSKMNLKVYPVGTVLCSCSANLGRCAITKAPLVTNQTFIGLVPGEKVINLFLFYVLTYNAEKLQRLSSGTTIAYLSRREFEKFKVYIPSNVDEQKKISDTLYECDSEIGLLTKELEALKQQKKSLMQKLLTGQIRVSLPSKEQNGYRN